MNVFLSTVVLTEFVQEKGTAICFKLARHDLLSFRIGDQILVGETIELAEQYRVLGIATFSSQNPESGYFLYGILLGDVAVEKVPQAGASIWLVRPDEP